MRQDDLGALMNTTLRRLIRPRFGLVDRRHRHRALMHLPAQAPERNPERYLAI